MASTKKDGNKKQICIKNVKAYDGRAKVIERFFKTIQLPKTER